MKLRVGDLVEVKSRDEILATLDQNACYEGLPFMPEMFKYCGRKIPVFRRAHKTCDSVNYGEKRRMANTVHLDDARCDGQAHGGCEAECMLFWKESWLRRIPAKSPTARTSTPVDAHTPGLAPAGPAACTESTVTARTCKTADSPADEPVYSCQATQLLQASAVLPWWDFRQYCEDYVSGNVGLKRILDALTFAAFEILIRRRFIGKRILWCYNRIQKMRGKPCYVYTMGRVPTGSPTPVMDLNLQPGELVRVKSFETILDTIDGYNRNRGLVWSAEMIPYCEGRHTVKKRIRQIIDERTGKMIRFKVGTVILDGVICEGRYSVCRYLCPRATYPYWREIWLERAVAGSTNDIANPPNTNV